METVVQLIGLFATVGAIWAVFHVMATRTHDDDLPRR